MEELLVDDSRQESLGVANLVSPPGQELLVLRNVTLRHTVRAPSPQTCVLFTPTQYQINIISKFSWHLLATFFAAREIIMSVLRRWRQASFYPVFIAGRAGLGNRSMAGLGLHNLTVYDKLQPARPWLYMTSDPMATGPWELGGAVAVRSPLGCAGGGGCYVEMNGKRCGPTEPWFRPVV